MIQLLTQFGDSSSGLGALGISLSNFLIQLGTFIVAFLILKKWAFKPILKVLRERRELIDKGVHLGEEMKHQQKELDKKVEGELKKAREKADGIIANSQSEARRIIREGEDTASQKAENLITDAKNHIELDVARARKQLEHDIVGLVSEATEVIIDEKVDAKKDASLIDRALKGRQSA